MEQKALLKGFAPGCKQGDKNAANLGGKSSCDIADLCESFAAFSNTPVRVDAELADS